jgi:hypothetical protein
VIFAKLPNEEVKAAYSGNEYYQVHQLHNRYFPEAGWMQDLQREPEKKWKSRTPMVRNGIREVPAPKQVSRVKIREGIVVDDVVLKPDLQESGDSSDEPESRPQISQSPILRIPCLAVVGTPLRFG